MYVVVEMRQYTEFIVLNTVYVEQSKQLAVKHNITLCESNFSFNCLATMYI